jgi:UDP-N-acetylglucosamine diphosphorylase/glucosamine-1-phosphate N-acetyltransferase
MEHFSDLAAIVLAAGKGTRMRSDRAKVLHEILGRPMIAYVVDAAKAIASQVIVVVGHQAEQVRQGIAADAAIRFAMQAPQLGTGHAVQCALASLNHAASQIVILCGDTPLIRPLTLQRLVQHHRMRGAMLTILTVEMDNPHGYGRVLTGIDGSVRGIVEEADASEEQKRIRVVNSGIYCVERSWLIPALAKLSSDNAQGEYYLTDILGIASREGVKTSAWVGPEAGEFLGVNTVEQLLAVERQLQRLCPERP